MTDTLMQLYYGELNPSQEFHYVHCENDRIDLQSQLETARAAIPEAFREGFRIGALLMLELLY